MNSKKKKKLHSPFKKHTLQTSKRKRAKPHHTRPYLCEAHLDKIKSTQNKTCFFSYMIKKTKTTTTTDRQIKVRFCWPSTTDHMNSYTKENQFWNNSTCSWWANILCTLNSFVIQCFCNSFTLQEVGWTRFVTLKTDTLKPFIMSLRHQKKKGTL